MTVWTPDWKLTVAGVDYTDIAISDIAHQAGRDDIYTQPNPSYLQVALVALSGQTLPFEINDSLSLQVKDSSGTYVNLFGGDVTDVTVEVGATGSLATVMNCYLAFCWHHGMMCRQLQHGQPITQPKHGQRQVIKV
jgi:hypothetical protein